MQRPAQNVNMDGSFELGWGMALLCFGWVPYLNAVLPKSIWASPWTAWISYLPMICLICAGFAPYGIPRMIMRFITWPRTGYVVNPNDVKLIQLVMLMVFGAALGFSLTLAIMLVGPITVAPAIPYPDVGPEMTPILGPFPPVMLSMGLAWCLSGVASLISFIRHNPPPPIETP
jgi:hypothetical protein